MKRYKITITLNSGDRVESLVSAPTEEEALSRLKADKSFIKFIGDDDIEGVNVVECGEEKPIDSGRFSVSEDLYRKGWYVVADLDNDIEVEFERGRYNESATIRKTGSKCGSALEEATALREIGEFMYVKFNELI